MTPNEVALVYLRQAKTLENFLNNFQAKDYSNQELREMFIAISQSYIELLYNLSIYLPLLTNYNVQFYKLDTLEKKMDLDQPPFEKEFFNQKR